MKRVILIHGWDGHPENHFKKWLKNSLEERGVLVIEPQLSGGEYPKLSTWMQEISQAVGTVDKDTCILGHSLGCVALVHFLNTLPAGQKLAGAVFVAGFFSDLNFSNLSEFYTDEETVKRAKAHCDNFVTIVSENDQSVPLSKALEFQKVLDAELILEKNKGHFCEEEGVLELPSALESVSKILSLS